MAWVALAALVLLARTGAADRDGAALELAGGAHATRAGAQRAHEIAAVQGSMRELRQRVDLLEAHEFTARRGQSRDLQEGQARELHVRTLGARQQQEDLTATKPTDDTTAGVTRADPSTDPTATKLPADTAAHNVVGGPMPDPASAQKGALSEPSELPKADALRELLDESSGPVVASMKAADESAATLLDSAKQWKQAGEDIKTEFRESVEKEVVQTGKTLEEEHGGVKQEADEKPKRVLEELKQRHAARAPGSAGNSSSAESALETGVARAQTAP